MTHETDGTRFLDFPIELHVSIAQYLAIRPRDLFSVLKTCRTLHGAYSQKCIWDTALRVICQRDALFEPSYPIQSMTVAQLQRAALGPDLWNKRLRSGKPFVGANVQAQVTTSNDIGEAGGGGRGRVYFVPGGRYLFEHFHSTISLWDLGLPLALRLDADHSPNSKITLVDRIDVAQGSTGRTAIEFAVHPSADGERLRLWIAITPSPYIDAGYMTRLSVYEIRPFDTKPRFQEISSIDASVSSLITSHYDLAMTTKLAIVHSFELIFIWDFMSNSYTVWNINQTPGTHDLLSLWHNSLIMVGSRDVLSWDIPTELDFEVPSSQVIDVYNHLANQPKPTLRATYDESISCKPLAWTLTHWYSSLDLPTLFDVEEEPVQTQSESSEEQTTGTRNGDNLTRVTRYQLNIPPKTQSPQSDSSSSTKPLALSHVQRLETIPLPLTQDTYPFLHRISGDILLSFFHGSKPGYHFGLIYGPFSASPYYPELQAKRKAGVGLKEGEDFGIVGMNLDWDGARARWLTFCSASGRVACSVISSSPLMGQNSIKVFDFSGILVG